MKAAIRTFALLVAVAGLAAASFAPATTKALSTRGAVSASDPGPTIGLPLPVPCQLENTCLVPSPSTNSTR